MDPVSKPAASRDEQPELTRTLAGAPASEPLVDASGPTLVPEGRVVGRKGGLPKKGARDDIVLIDDASRPVVRASIIVEISKLVGDLPPTTVSDFDAIFGREARGFRAQLSTYSKSELRFFRESLKGSNVAAWQLPFGKLMYISGVTSAAAFITGLVSTNPQLSSLTTPIFIGGLVACVMIRSYAVQDAGKMPFVHTLIQKGIENMRLPSVRSSIGAEIGASGVPKVLENNSQLRAALERALDGAGAERLVPNPEEDIRTALAALSEVYPDVNPDDPELVAAARYVQQERG